MSEEERVGHSAEGDVGEIVEGGAEGVALAGDPPLGADLVVVVLGARLGQDQHAHQDVERLQGVVAWNRCNSFEVLIIKSKALKSHQIPSR